MTGQATRRRSLTAVALHASIPAAAIGDAIGEAVANTLQPFRTLPMVAIAGI